MSDDTYDIDDLEADDDVPAPVVARKPEKEPVPLPPPPENVSAQNPILTVGRRKAATARIRMYPGEGNVVINGRPLDAYFHLPQHRAACTQAMEETGTRKDYDIRVNVHGGGITGQAGAVMLGVARGLTILRPDLGAQIKTAGLRRRDSRIVERKKYGRAGARRGFQFSKR